MSIDENNHVNTTTEDPSTSAPVDPDVIAFPALQHGCFAPWMDGYVIQKRA